MSAPAPSTDSELHAPLGAAVRHMPATDDDLLRQCVLETAQRTSTGLFIYPAVWLTLALALDETQEHPGFVWGHAGALLVLMGLRTWWNRRLPDALQHSPTQAGRVFNALVLFTALYWGTLTAWCERLAPGSAWAWIMLACTIGFCAGGNTMFAIHPRLRFTYPVLMILPVVGVHLLDPTPEHLAVVVLAVVLALYLLKSSRLVYHDYWAGKNAQRLAEQRAQALEMASLTDGLTRIPNRMHFDRQFAYEWARQCRHGGSMAVLIIDLDHFKAVNDRHGHLFGDRCLQEVAAALGEACNRSTDFVARYGGEEFVALLVETELTGAIQVAERMLMSVRGLHIESDTGAVPVSCSIGVALVQPKHRLDRADVLRRADAALYRAKHLGRDRIVIDEAGRST